MKHFLLLGVALLAAPVLAGQIYEWKDPKTGRLQSGDKPPENGIQYWAEGEKRPEQKAAEQREQTEKQRIEKQKWDEGVRRSNEEIERINSESVTKKARICTGDPHKFGVKIGMNKADFQVCFGMAPAHINTTTTASGTQEQWVYRISDKNMYFYFTNGILTAIQN